MNSPKIPSKNEKGNYDEKHKHEVRQRQIRFWISYLIVGFIGMWLFQQFILTSMLIRQSEIPYSEFKSKIASGQIVEVTLGESRIEGTMKNPDASDAANENITFTTVTVPNGDPTLIPALDKAGIKYSVSQPSSPLGSILLSYDLPLSLIGGIWYVGYRRMAKGGLGAGGILGVGKSKATEVKPENIGVTYQDVGGADEAIRGHQ